MKVKFCLLVFLMSFNMCWFLRVNVRSLWFYLRRVLPPLPFLLSWSPFTHFFCIFVSLLFTSLLFAALRCTAANSSGHAFSV